MIKNMFSDKLNMDSFLIRWILSSVAYWILSYIALTLIQNNVLSTAILFVILTILTVIYRLSIYVRRLRDANKNVWIAIIGLFPLLDVILAFALLFDLKKWIILSVILIILFLGSLPALFISEIVIGENKYKNSTKLNNCYLIYKNEVYYHSYSEFHYFDKLDTTPDQFEALDPVKCYGKDNKNVYIKDKIIKDADPKTFIVTDEGYEKDENDYYNRY